MGICNNKERNKKVVILENKPIKNLIINKKSNFDNFECKITGFSNIGNSCYMNSFLQILLHCPNFVKELQNLYQHCSFENNLIKNIIDLSKSEYPYNKKYLYEIKNCMKNIEDYGLFIQNDSQDFGKDLINEIIDNIKHLNEDFSSSISYSESEIIDKKNKIYKYQKFVEKYQNKETFIEKMFTINECEYIFEEKNITKVIFNTSFDILLSFPKIENNNYKKEYSLENLLDLNFNNNNKNYINITRKDKKEKNLKTTITKLCKLPKILMISIVRAIIKEDLIKSSLNYPALINLEKYIDKDLININKNKAYYKLFAINEHDGNEYKSGHYYCHIKIKNEWFSFFDDKVIKTKENLSSKNVVGLFYKYIDE